MADRPTQRPSLLRAATRPLPLLLLAAGGVTGALVAWPLAIGGAVAYLAGVAWSSRGPASGSARALAAPVAPAELKLRSTEVLAAAVRARKAHRGLHEAIAAGDATMRELHADIGARATQLMAHVHEIAQKADLVRARLDAAAVGGAPLAADARERLEKGYRDSLAELHKAGASLEAWQAGALAGATLPGDAERAAREVAEEIEQLHRVARELERVTR